MDSRPDCHVVGLRTPRGKGDLTALPVQYFHYRGFTSLRTTEEFVHRNSRKEKSAYGSNRILRTGEMAAGKKLKRGKKNRGKLHKKLGKRP